MPAAYQTNGIITTLKSLSPSSTSIINLAHTVPYKPQKPTVKHFSAPTPTFRLAASPTHGFLHKSVKSGTSRPSLTNCHQSVHNIPHKVQEIECKAVIAQARHQHELLCDCVTSLPLETAAVSIATAAFHLNPAFYASIINFAWII